MKSGKPVTEEWRNLICTDLKIELAKTLQEIITMAFRRETARHIPMVSRGELRDVILWFLVEKPRDVSLWFLVENRQDIIQWLPVGKLRDILN